MAQETEEIAIEIAKLFPVQGKWTEEDYFRLPETNKIIELSEGRIIITPSPTTQHQKILSKLFLLTGNHVLSNNLGEIVVSPMDVRLWPGTIRQPDIVYMSNEHRDRISEQYWGIPDLVIEILSESTATEDRTSKFIEYEKAGITEYWLLDIASKTIEVFVLDQASYKLLGKWGTGEVIQSKVLAGLQVAVDSVMTD